MWVRNAKKKKKRKKNVCTQGTDGKVKGTLHWSLYGFLFFLSVTSEVKIVSLHGVHCRSLKTRYTLYVYTHKHISMPGEAAIYCSIQELQVRSWLQFPRRYLIVCGNSLITESIFKLEIIGANCLHKPSIHKELLALLHAHTASIDGESLTGLTVNKLFMSCIRNPEAGRRHSVCAVCCVH